jgi:hypothetical protein
MGQGFTLIQPQVRLDERIMSLNHEYFVELKTSTSQSIMRPDPGNLAAARVADDRISSGTIFPPSATGMGPEYDNTGLIGDARYIWRC